MKVKRGLPAFLFITILLSMIPCKGLAYLMPAEQLVGMMTANFSKFKTLFISQSICTLNQDDEGSGIPLEENLWLKSPGLYRSELLAWSGDKGVDLNTDRVFCLLLMANNAERITGLLTQMGVNLNSVALIRVDGIIAYCVGDKTPGSPRLLIEKERFVPLLLSYGLSRDTGTEIVTVRFNDYRKLGRGWYPYEIVYSVGEGMRQRYSIIRLQVNIPIDGPLLMIPEQRIIPVQRFENHEEMPEEKRLEEAVEALKEKYR